MTTDLNPEGMERAAEAAVNYLSRDGSALPWDELSPMWRKVYREQAAAMLTAYLGHTEVTTVEELDALPWWSLVQGHDGFKHLRHPDGWMLAVFGGTKPHLAREIELPATVLHRPTP